MEQEPKTDTLDTPATPPSAVDSIFDTVTARAAKGLLSLQTTLEAVARWIDGRARVVGSLATKLGPPTTSSAHAKS